MRGFVSYRSTDLSIVEAMQDYLEDEIDLDYWDASNQPGEPDWDSIEGWIDEAAVFIVVVTQRTVDQAISVGQEIGMARAKGKIIIPVVAADVSPSRLGFLKGTTAIRFDPDDPAPAFERLSEVIEDIRRGNWREGLILAGLATGALVWLNNREHRGGGSGNQHL